MFCRSLFVLLSFFFLPLFFSVLLLIIDSEPFWYLQTFLSLPKCNKKKLVESGKIDDRSLSWLEWELNYKLEYFLRLFVECGEKCYEKIHAINTGYYDEIQRVRLPIIYLYDRLFEYALTENVLTIGITPQHLIIGDGDFQIWTWEGRSVARLASSITRLSQGTSSN